MITNKTFYITYYARTHNGIKLENINRQLRIQDVLSVLLTQSTKLIEIINANQKEVNRLKAELDKLKGVA